MNNSVILQVDESTKGLMEEIQSGISDSIDDRMREVKDMVDSVNGTTDRILQKFKNFDGLSSTVDQLRALAQESKDIADKCNKEQSISTEIKIKIQDIAGKIDETSKSIKEEIGKLSKDLDEKSAEIVNEIKNVANSHKEFEDKTSDQIKKINESMEKAQATLDIIVNLVTPFWKKW